MKRICVLNGSGGVGKNTFAELCAKTHGVEQISSVDEVKKIARLMGWNGEKDEASRRMLSDLKDLMTNWGDLPLKYILKEIDIFLHESIDARNSILFIDIREPIEIEQLIKTVSQNYKVTTVLIRNNNVKKITSNHADNNVENYNYDYIIENNECLKMLEESAIEFVNDIFGEDDITNG